MVQVQSTWFPLIDRNPQTFVDIPNAEAEDYRLATQSVMRSRSQPSAIEVRVLSDR
jgi:predicted acyl esterase